MTTLISPANGRPCAFVASSRGYIQLRCDYVTPQTRWFSLAQIEAANPVHTCAEPPKPLTVAESLVLETTPELIGKHWQLSVTRDDPVAVAMYHRHYSYKARGRKPTKFGNPGHYIALMTLKRDALWLWSKEKHRKDGQTGVNCAVFRNEGDVLSSELIAEAVDIAQRRWPGERLFTFVDGSKITSKNPGYCFKQAGWKACGTTGTGLLIFEWKRPTQITVQLPAELLKDVDAKLSLGVRMVQKPTLYSEWLKVA